MPNLDKLVAILSTILQVNVVHVQLPRKTKTAKLHVHGNFHVCVVYNVVHDDP